MSPRALKSNSSAGRRETKHAAQSGCFKEIRSSLNIGCYLLLLVYLLDWANNYTGNAGFRATRKAATSAVPFKLVRDVKGTPSGNASALAQNVPATNSSSSRNELVVVDTIMYNGEPVVPVRLELLYNVVDRFYITESKLTHSGHVKPKYSDLHSELFRPYEDKITWLFYEDPPDFNVTPSLGGDNWKREQLQRQYSLQQMRQDVEDGRLPTQFIIVNTDADEIPNPAVLREFQPGFKWHTNAISRPMFLEMKWLCYNANWRKLGNWTPGHTLPGAETLFGKYSLQSHRNGRISKKSPDRIPEAGWHLTYFMGIEDIIRKLESFAHQEFNRAKLKSPGHIMDCILNGKDLYGRTFPAEQLEPHDALSLPVPIQRLHQEIMAKQGIQSIS